MIVNNFNDSLPENKVTNWTFDSRIAPKIFVREFNSRLFYSNEAKLIIPYYVTDYFDGVFNFVDDKDASVKKTYYNKISQTFTTIITLNSELDDSDSRKRSYKKTTYRGEHIFEISDFDELDIGVHYFSIETIQSDGNSSGLQFFKYYLEDPNELKTLVDLTTSEFFNFDSSYEFNINEVEGNTLENFSTKLVLKKEYEYSTSNGGSWKLKSNPVFKKTNLSSYKVECFYDDNSIEYIKITVPKDKEIDGYSYGYSYYSNVMNWITYHNVNGAILSASDTNKSLIEDISGIYYLTTVYVDENNVKHKLKDYVSLQPSEIPDEVIKICIKNKLALNRLCEAAQAYGGSGKVTLKLPLMDIVLDRHKLSKSGNIVDPKYRDITNPATPINSYYDYDDNIEFPDNFTLDLNGSKISVLQSTDLNSGHYFPIINNFDTHVINGIIQGSQKYLKYRNQQRFPEFLSNAAIYGCDFCTYENMEITYTTGYDCQISADDSNATLGVFNYQPKCLRNFNSLGYIDYSGNFNDTSEYYKSILRDKNPDLPADFNFKSEFDKLIVLRCNRAPEIGYPYERTPRELLGNVWIPTMITKSSGNTRTLLSKELFIHFFDEDNKFISTLKLMSVNPIPIPKNAKFCLFSVVGYSYTDYSNDLNNISLSSGSGQYIVYSEKISYCNGFINCKFHHQRTSLFDNSGSTQNYAKNCFTWNFGIRYSTEGGFSNQNFLVDIEDDAHLSNNFYVNNFEHIFGKGVWMIQQGCNNSFDKCRGFNVSFQKTLLGGGVFNSTLTKINIGNGYTDPVRYNTYKCNISNVFNNTKGSKGSLGSSKGKNHTEYSTYGSIEGNFKDNLYTYEVDLVNK
jgi:hypothetical protein